MLQSLALQTHLMPGEQVLRRDRNISYLMSLESDNLLLSHYFEAGLKSFSYNPKGIHGGWDSPLCEIRGTVVGHWLSAAAFIYSETGNMELKQKADYIVSEIGRCQKENGGEWAFPIPEKYLYWLKKKKSVWAPQYVCHKNMMGLLDMYLYADNQQALDIVLKCADWFYNYTNDISRELMNEIMEEQETGGMMMHFANLYAVTKEEKHLELVRRYERPLLFKPIEDGVDILTNMHANTTIPEILGAARAYEVTGEERYRKVVESYWNLAVTRRGTFATGGQSSGEVWTPMQKQSARLGSMNQEHCVVYNMMMLSEFLFRWTGDSQYADYYERNLYNGIFAQGHYESQEVFQNSEGKEHDTGLITYYLSLTAGSTKKWGSATDDFWCCHCTLLQANAIHHTGIYYQKDTTVTVSQYLPSKVTLKMNDTEVEMNQRFGNDTGETIGIRPEAYERSNYPSSFESIIDLKMDADTEFTMRLRLPWWLSDKPSFYINEEQITFTKDKNGFALITKTWSNEDCIRIVLPKQLACYPLPDRDDTVAFLDGPVALAALLPEERMMYGDINHPETMLTLDDERTWNRWNQTYRTINQPVGFKLKPLYDIGHEKYTVYFQIKKA